MSAARHVVGYGWDAGRAQVRFAEGAPLILDGEVRFRRLAGRRCLGFVDRETGGRHPCPTAEEVRGQCVACSRREGFWACMTCDGFRCPPLKPAMAQYCQQPHVLYLACFGGQVLKVGTSSWPRRERRVVEQGPLSAAHVAAGPGPLIKQTEALAVRLGYAERFGRGEKWRAFQSSLTEDEAHGKIVAAAQDLAERLPASHAGLLFEPRFVPTADYGEFRGARLVAIGPGDLVAGRVVGARGHLVLLDDGAGAFAVDLGAFKSGFLDLAPTGGRPPARQLGLF